MRDIPNSKELKVFVKGAFVLIGLFAVLHCSVAVLILHFCFNLACNYFILILFFASVPLLVFLIFSCFVKSHYKNLYGLSNNEGFIIKMQRLKMEEHETQKFEQKLDSFERELEMQKNDMQKIEGLIESCLSEIKTIKPDSEKTLDAFLENLDKIIERFSKWKSNNT